MTTRSILHTPLLLAALLAMSLAACSSEGQQGKGPGAAGAGGPPPAEVDVMTPATTSAALTADLPGRAPHRSVRVLRASSRNGYLPRVAM